MAEELRTSGLQEPVEIVEYLYRRLHEVGIRSVHGLPGDYNLVALDSLGKCGLEWVGNVNELNAGYAADGYARVKGISAVITTFGVGELSLLNAIAGSYAEFVPVVHIVGTPSTISQKNGMLLHHTLGNGDFKVFANMSSNISCAVANLVDPNTAASLIDYAITECYIKSRPVYITLPTDMVCRKVEGARLKQPLDLKFPDNDPEQEEYVVETVMRHINNAKCPVILVDACSSRHRALDETHELIKKSGFPTFVTPMGKGAVDETIPNFCGVYAGDGSTKEVQELFAKSDLVLSIGAIKSDFNTAGFSYHTSQLNTIDFHSNFVKVSYSEYRDCRMNSVLKKVTAKLEAREHTDFDCICPTCSTPPEEVKSDSQVITHDWFWPKLSDFMRKGDIVISETGTSGYGVWNVKYAEDTIGISQILWGSIGYAAGSCQGAALAAKELGKGQRTILFTGDGSFQLTVQELSTMIRKKLNPIIFVICNEGFTIERFIHGMEATYNDIGDWKYRDLPAVFGAKEDEYKSYQVKTRDEALKLLKDEEFATAKKLRLVELHMPKDDAPGALKLTAEASAKNNAKLQ